jgi:hypothetical protein
MSRFRVRWRLRAARLRQELGITLDIAVTLGLVVTGLMVANSSLPETAKVPLVILLAVCEIIFLFSRLIFRQLRRIERNSLIVIPHEGLCRIISEHLDQQRTKLLSRAAKLEARHTCDLEKPDMYDELIGLTEVVTRVCGGRANARIDAISSTNIEDFEDEPLAEAYLDANRRAVDQRVRVRRLFVLDEQQARDRRVRNLIHEHAAALTNSDGRAAGSGVRWILRSHVPAADRRQDFALFAQEALVTQAPSGERFELSQDLDKVERAVETFQRLWSHAQVQAVRELDNR